MGWGTGIVLDYVLTYSTVGYLFDVWIIDRAESDGAVGQHKKAEIWKQLVTRREQLAKRRP
ncbi:hypothetical protein HZA87_02850 [Candidatus Uhrbacteria bacterium]|nr:hypothetical protein [Candidatus Uhrbacteria bacterium]